MLTCSCDYEAYPGMIVWDEIGDYKILDAKRAKRCCSCKEKISIGDVCCEIERYKIPESDIECKIYGEDGEIPRASKFMCEKCADIFNNLEALGFCRQPWEDQRDLLREYVESYK